MTYVGPLYGQALLDEYASASVLVLPSRHESSPMVVQQAMAAALPVIASRSGGADRLVDDGTTGVLVAADDVMALADAIDRLLTGADLGSMGRASRSAADRFRERTVALATLEAYDEVLRSARPAPR